MIIEVSAIIIACISLFVSIYVVLRDKEFKQEEYLYLARQRIFEMFDKGEILTPEELQEYCEENPDSEEAKKYKARSSANSMKFEREFEYTCYLVLKKKIDFTSFFDLFKSWLAVREYFWPKTAKYKIKNLKYTWSVIELCKKRGFLPLKKPQP